MFPTQEVVHLKRTNPFVALIFAALLLIGCGDGTTVPPTATLPAATATSLASPPTATLAASLPSATPAQVSQLATVTSPPAATSTPEQPTANPPTAPTATNPPAVNPDVLTAEAQPTFAPTEAATRAPISTAVASEAALSPTAAPFATQPQPTAAEIVTPANQRIALIYDGRLATVNADGSGLKLLTGIGASNPRWSPDHLRIAFAFAEGKDARLHIIKADGSGDLGIADSGGNDANPAWSPDSSTVAFEVRNADRSQIALVDRAGGQLRLIADGQQPTWRSDGQVIGFVTYGLAGDSSNSLRLTSAQGKNEWQPLAYSSVPQDLSAYNYPFSPGTTSLGNPQYSASGRIALAARGHSGLVLSVNGQGQDLQVLGFSYEGGIGALDWSPSSSYLAYENQGASGITTVNIVDSSKAVDANSTPLASFGSPQNSSGYRDPAWSPSGKQLALVALDGERSSGLAISDLSSPRLVLKGNVTEIDW